MNETNVQSGIQLRAIALLREDITDKELEALNAAGVRVRDMPITRERIVAAMSV